MNIKKSHVSDQVLQVLRKKIMLNQLKEGEHLKESELSNDLAVSRGPIREAIAVLETEGLVEKLVNGRTVVRSFSIQDVRNLYESRILLEKYALTQIDTNTLEAKQMELYDCVDKMQESYDNHLRNIDADLEFHSLLVKMTGNKTLIQLWVSLQGIIQTLIDVTSEFIQQEQQGVVDQHRKVIDALVQGEVEKAQEVLCEHLENASDYYCKSLEALNKEEKK